MNKSREIDARARTLLADDNAPALHELAQDIAGRFVTVEFRKLRGLTGEHDLRNDLKSVATFAAVEAVNQWLKGARGGFYADIGASVRKALDDHRRTGGLRVRVTQRGGYDGDARKFHTDAPAVPGAKFDALKRPKLTGKARDTKRQAARVAKDADAAAARQAQIKAAETEANKQQSAFIEKHTLYKERSSDAENTRQSSQDNWCVSTGAETAATVTTYNVFAGRAFGEGFSGASIAEKLAADWLWTNHAPYAALFEKIIIGGGARSANAGTFELAIWHGTPRYLSRHKSTQAYYEGEIRQGLRLYRGRLAEVREAHDLLGTPDEHAAIDLTSASAPLPVPPEAIAKRQADNDQRTTDQAAADALRAALPGAKPLTVPWTSPKRPKPRKRAAAPPVTREIPLTVTSAVWPRPPYDPRTGKGSMFRLVPFGDAKRRIKEEAELTLRWHERDYRVSALQTFYARLVPKSLLDDV